MRFAPLFLAVLTIAAPPIHADVIFTKTFSFIVDAADPSGLRDEISPWLEFGSGNIVFNEYRFKPTDIGSTFTGSTDPQFSGAVLALTNGVISGPTKADRGAPGLRRTTSRKSPRA